MVPSRAFDYTLYWTRIYYRVYYRISAFACGTYILHTCGLCVLGPCKVHTLYIICINCTNVRLQLEHSARAQRPCTACVAIVFIRKQTLQPILRNHNTCMHFAALHTVTYALVNTHRQRASAAACNIAAAAARGALPSDRKNCVNYVYMWASECDFSVLNCTRRMQNLWNLYVWNVLYPKLLRSLNIRSHKSEAILFVVLILRHTPYKTCKNDTIMYIH